jgi:hypothetical protein
MAKTTTSSSDISHLQVCTELFYKNPVAEFAKSVKIATLLFSKMIPSKEMPPSKPFQAKGYLWLKTLTLFTGVSESNTGGSGETISPLE